MKKKNSIATLECKFLREKSKINYPEFKFQDFTFKVPIIDSIKNKVTKEFKIPPYEIIGLLNFANFLIKKHVRENNLILKKELFDEAEYQILKVQKIINKYFEFKDNYYNYFNVNFSYNCTEEQKQNLFNSSIVGGLNES